MKTRLMIAAAAVVLCTSAIFAAEIKLEGVKCVVASKKAAKADNFVAYKGGKVFFCCQGCPKAFAKDTAKFAPSANQQLFVTKQAKQIKCPLTGKPINAKMTVKVGTTEVGLCCAGCKGKVAKAKGAAQVKLVFNDKAFAKGFKVASAK